MDVIQINKKDNVVVALIKLEKNKTVDFNNIKLLSNIGKGHKIAIEFIKSGEKIYKYGFKIGFATKDIKKGELIHTHNIKTLLKDNIKYSYNNKLNLDNLNTNKLNLKKSYSFNGYKRKNGEIGIRNEIWVIASVGCINNTLEIIKTKAKIKYKNLLEKKQIDDIKIITHPYGCSQLGDDLENTQKILSNLIKHPNAAGVLLIGLGCENNQISTILSNIEDIHNFNIAYFNTQDVENEILYGLDKIEYLIEKVKDLKQERFDVSNLKIGLKCGGSDAFSGITANPLVGEISNIITENGGTAILTEVPEMFGAEQILMNHAIDEKVYTKIVNMINNFKNYYINLNQPIYENPSPGNKNGGITTLEEKSLGCVQKAGISKVVDCLEYGEKSNKKGLNLLTGPGNDIVAVSNLVAAGAHIILFTTGRGTPLGSLIPTIKISSNFEIYKKKNIWFDYNAGDILEGKTLEKITAELFEFVLKIVSKEKYTKNEINGYFDFTIFKNGVTL